MSLQRIVEKGGYILTILKMLRKYLAYSRIVKKPHHQLVITEYIPRFREALGQGSP